MSETPPDVNEDGSIDGLSASFVEVDGHRTRYYHEGSGEPLLCCHGGQPAGTSSANNWSTNVSGLGEYFEVFVPDRLACGLTDAPDDPEAYTFDAEVDHLLAFVDECGLDSFHLAGQSLGANLAAAIAAERPDAVRTLAIANGGNFGLEWGDFDHRRGVIMANLPEDPAERFRRRHGQVSYSTDHITDEYVATGVRFASTESAQRAREHLEDGGRANWHRSMGRRLEEVRDAVEAGDLAVPTTLFWGANDLFAPLEEGRALYELLTQANPDVRLYVMNQAGHFPFREHPEEFNRLLATTADLRG